MRLQQLHVAVSALLVSYGLASDTAATQKATVWTWPVSSKSPQQLAQVSYKGDSSNATVDSYTPPPAPYEADNLIRVGLYDPKTSEWRGVVTSASSFDPIYQHKLTLHVDDAVAEPYHVGFTAYAKQPPQELAKAKRKAERSASRAARSSQAGKPTDVPIKGAKKTDEDEQPLLVVIERPVPGPTPHLNKPVVLSPDGKAPEAEPEKSFIQKYWWVLAAFLVLQVFMAAAPEDKK
ncbi:MAG: hypothetical protein M1828_007235 [Chrysothrix sp. TS-e1954]|nr:MAG: hypothetical protein M1828_007235 [Chrysothrix sp. TS-e1954]